MNKGPISSTPVRLCGGVSKDNQGDGEFGHGEKQAWPGKLADGLAGTDQEWQMNRKLKSQNYLGDWKGLLAIK